METMDMNEAAKVLFYLQTSPVISPRHFKNEPASKLSSFKLPSSSYVDRTTTRSMAISNSKEIEQMEEEDFEDEDKGPGSALLALLNLNRLCPTINSTETSKSRSSDEASISSSKSRPKSPLRTRSNRDRSVSLTTVEKRFSSEAMSISQNKIGHYSLEERRRLIDRFLQKRHSRIWRKRVKYDVRKSFADSRLRVKGRFVRKEDEDQLRELLIMAF